MIKTVPMKKNYEFMRAYKKGKFFVGKFIILYILANNFGINRIGITVGKKVGKSVKRNRIKRLTRECYRFYEEFILSGFDCVFVARSFEKGKMPDFYDIKKEMKFLLKKTGVLNQEKWNCLRKQ